ncbi:MAG: hypothetical protein JSR82_05775 [Verrucomicrobia bacterium]|nr:hypothetical protein [Verrucomicrobiota bacterium]
MNAITHTSSVPDAILSDPNIESVAKLGLVIRAGVAKTDWTRAVANLLIEVKRNGARAESMVAWLGDFLAYGGGRYRGRIKEYALAAGLHPTTLRNAKLVCTRISLARRRENLPWSHHVTIGTAFECPNLIDQWLGRAEREQLSREDLRRLIRAAKGVRHDARKVTALPEGVRTIRELRQVAKLLIRARASWAAWSPEVCANALKDLNPVREFMAAISTRAQEAGSRVLPS